LTPQLKRPSLDLLPPVQHLFAFASQVSPILTTIPAYRRSRGQAAIDRKQAAYPVCIQFLAISGLKGGLAYFSSAILRQACAEEA